MSEEKKEEKKTQYRKAFVGAMWSTKWGELSLHMKIEEMEELIGHARERNEPKIRLFIRKRAGAGSDGRTQTHDCYYLLVDGEKGFEDAVGKPEAPPKEHDPFA